MPSTRTLPDIAFVRVLTPGGPYRIGAILSVAFVTPDAGRLAPHDAPSDVIEPRDHSDLIPETISACVLRAAGPYAAGASLTLSFVDPSVARIHETAPDGRREQHDRDGLVDRRHAAPKNVIAENDRPIPIASTPTIEHVDVRQVERIDPQTAATPPETIATETIASLLVTGPAPSLARAHARRGARVRLDWNRDRIRRFVQVVDKLFAIDRLGWYRHVFAMRLLVPDTVVCGDSQTDVEALRHLHALRAASIETLGRPLLAAFMPNFTVTSDWLDSLDKPAAARALAGLRESLLPFAGDDTIQADECETGWTIASIQRSEIERVPATSVEALLPLFIPYTSAIPELTEKLAAYRSTLIDIFGSATQPAEAVRIHQMSEPNHALDDRLRQLSVAVSEAFGGLVVA
jgi:hypothetical protein